MPRGLSAPLPVADSRGRGLKQVLSPASVATDNAGNHYIGDYNTASIYEASQNGEIRHATRRSSGLSFAC